MNLEKILTLKAREEGGFEIIENDGAINAANSPILRKAIKNAFKKSNRGVICDMAHVTYMDSSGVATMVEGVQIAEQLNKHFILTGVQNEQITHLFEITRLTDLFSQYDSPSEAIQQINQQKAL